MSKDLEQLIAAARKHNLVPAEKEEQRWSFAYGNTKIENPLITRELIDREAEELQRQKQSEKSGA